jgi:hypothetical protein
MNPDSRYEKLCEYEISILRTCMERHNKFDCELYKQLVTDCQEFKRRKLKYIANTITQKKQ